MQKSLCWKEQKAIRNLRYHLDMIIVIISRLYRSVVIRYDLDDVSQLLVIRHHLDLLGLAYCSAIRGVVQVLHKLPSV